ncbi:MAG: hypothetical protein M3041_11185, partial [Acidobacteriota bacterium]|nr:hypothetical protein [Acidobacteriota bacterium]
MLHVFLSEGLREGGTLADGEVFDAHDDGTAGQRPAFHMRMQPRFALFLVAAALYIPALLLADSRGLVPQLALGLATLMFLALFAHRSEVATRQIVCAILVATTGEVVLSLGWGLYTYRNALIPLYVPFGHGLFYLLAAESAHQPALRRHARAITRAVLAAGSVIAAVSLIFFHDQWGLLW